MESGKLYVRSQLKRTVIGVMIATALLAGAWFISNGGSAGPGSVAPARSVIQSGATDDLRVAVSGVRNDQGFIIGSLCKEGELFVSGCSLKARSKATEGVVSLDFRGLAPGDYALALYHDENNNSRLELGTEGIGFSNNANLARTAPDFNASRIKVRGSTPIRIRLRYSVQ